MDSADRAVLDGLVRDLGDRSLVRGIVDLFLELLPERHEAVVEAAAARDVLRLRRAARLLGSGSATVGAVPLLGACQQLEAAESGADLVVGPLLRELASACSLTQAALRSWLAG